MASRQLYMHEINRLYLLQGPCPDCGCVIYGTDWYAHILLVHQRIPRQEEISYLFYPTRDVMTQLLPHVNKIVRQIILSPYTSQGDRAAAFTQEFYIDERVGVFRRSKTLICID